MSFNYQQEVSNCNDCGIQYRRGTAHRCLFAMRELIDQIKDEFERQLVNQQTRIRGLEEHAKTQEDGLKQFRVQPPPRDSHELDAMKNKIAL